MAEIKSLSICHQAIMDYLMAHPTERLQDVAKAFGYTPAWLSQIIHSDAFQVMLKEKQGIAFHETVLTIKDKMMVTAHAALDKLNDMLPSIQDPRTINDITENMLDRLGFGAKPINGNVTINQQNNMVVPNTNAAEIAAARKLLEARRVSALGVALDGHGVPIALPREGQASVGEALSDSRVLATEGEYTEGEGRDQIRTEGSLEAV